MRHEDIEINGIYILNENPYSNSSEFVGERVRVIEKLPYAEVIIEFVDLEHPHHPYASTAWLDPAD